MKHVIFETVTGSPDTEEWHLWRAGGLGGSDAVQIAAAAELIEPPSWANPGALVAQKLHLYEVEMNAAMQRGKGNEEAVRAQACAILDTDFLPAFGEMEEEPIIRASFDGISFDDEILEIKCPNTKVHDLAKRGIVVDYYRPQLAHQLMVLHGHPNAWRGDERVVFVSAVPETGDIAVVSQKSWEYRELGLRLLEAERATWRRIEALRQDEHTQAVIDLLQDERLLTHWQEIAWQERRLDQAKKFIREHLTSGGGTRLPARLVTRKRKQTDYAALAAAPEVLERYQRRSWCATIDAVVDEIESIDEAESIYLSASRALQGMDEGIKAWVQKAKQRLAAFCSFHEIPIRVNSVRVYARTSTDWKRLCEAEGLTPPTKTIEYTMIEFKEST